MKEHPKPKSYDLLCQKGTTFSPDEHEMILTLIYRGLDSNFPRKRWLNKKKREQIAELYQKFGQFLGEKIEVKAVPKDKK